MYNIIILSCISVAGIIWLLGILRALFLYLKWLRSQKWYQSLSLLIFANLGPLFFAFKPELLDHSLSQLQTVLMVLFGIGGLCMLIYLSVAGMVHGILLCDAGQRNWRRLNIWHRILSVGLILELLILCACLILAQS